MIRATELAGRAVIDIDAAERLGTIDKLILDPDGRRVAGFVISRGSGFPGNKAQTIIPAAAIHAIGPDAVTVHQKGVAGSNTEELEKLPRGSDVIGRKIVSEDGRFLGKVSDVLIDRETGSIIGYLLSEHTPSKKLEEMLGDGRKKRRDLAYLPADANLRTGRDLIVASEDAVRYDWSEEDFKDAPSVLDAPSRWTRSPSPGPGTRSGAAAEADLHPMAPSGVDLDGRETNPHVR
jgi:sporulation protein YlmC with PRC-barrel domain